MHSYKSCKENTIFVILDANAWSNQIKARREETGHTPEINREGKNLMCSHISKAGNVAHV